MRTHSSHALWNHKSPVINWDGDRRLCAAVVEQLVADFYDCMDYSLLYNMSGDPKFKQEYDKNIGNVQAFFKENGMYDIFYRFWVGYSSDTILRHAKEKWIKDVKNGDRKRIVVYKKKHKIKVGDSK